MVDDRGCRACFCAPSSTIATAGTTVAATTASFTTETMRPATTVVAGVCQEQSCRCKPGAVVSWTRDGNGCAVCFCVHTGVFESSPAPPSSFAPQTRAYPSTVATPETRPITTTIAPRTAFECPAVDVCRCKPDAHVVYQTDSNGCRSCYCEAGAPFTTTSAPETRPITTTIAPTPAFECPAVDVCRCKPDAHVMYQTDSNGCRSCYCEAGAPFTTTSAPETRPITTTITTVPSTTLCPVAHVCHCRPDSHIVYQTDNLGCRTCYCAHSGTRPPPSSTVMATTKGN